MAKKIRVLVIDDSLMFRTMMTKALNESPDIEVVGTAGDAFEAKDKIFELRPDVLTLDVEMPKMNGIEFLKKLLPQYKVAVIVVTSSAVNAFEAISAGAVEYIKKPSAKDMSTFMMEIRKSVKVASTARVNAGRYSQTAIPAVPKSPILMRQPIIDAAKTANTVIAIGASTGGTDAIQVVVEKLPPTTPGIVIVQHMPAGFTKMYADRLNRVCQMEVREAVDGDRLKQGLILLGAGEHHLRLLRDTRGYYVSSKRGDKVSGHCPSVDVLFDSVSETAGKNAIGVILTGMGADGAKGMLKMKQAGAHTIGQDKDSCIVYGMPMVAFNLGGVIKQSPLQNISNLILEKLR